MPKNSGAIIVLFMERRSDNGNKIEMNTAANSKQSGSAAGESASIRKAAQRKKATAARRALYAETRAEKSRRISGFMYEYLETLKKEMAEAGVPPVRTIFSYAAAWDEADLSEFHRKARAEGIRIAFPLCHGAGIMEAVVPGGNHAESDGDTSEQDDYPAEYWRTGAYGIREPVPELAVPVKPEDIDLVIDSLITRKFGDKIYVDLEIGVDGNMKLKEAHDIAENVHDHIEKNFHDVKHVMVHLNPKGYDYTIRG